MFPEQDFWLRISRIQSSNSWNNFMGARTREHVNLPKHFQVPKQLVIRWTTVGFSRRSLLCEFVFYCQETAYYKKCAAFWDVTSYIVVGFQPIYYTMYTPRTSWIKTHHITASSIPSHRLNNFKSKNFGLYPFLTCVYIYITGYGLDGPGIETRWARDFPHLSRPALGPTQSPVQWVSRLSWG
jgi:hypothetical protein